MPAFPCGYCQKSFGNIAAMKIHIASDHSDQFHTENDESLLFISTRQIPPNGKSLQTDDNNSNMSKNVQHEFECFPCQLGFVSELELQNHIDDKHNLSSSRRKIKVEIETAKSAETKSSKDPKIEDHDKLKVDVSRFVGQNSRNENTSEEHYLEIENNFVANEASVSETSAMSLETNDNQNTENKWNCTKCDKTFKFRSRLERHSIIHNPQNQERVFQCPTCPKKFLRSGYICIHLS
jgi:hypothetical protein